MSMVMTVERLISTKMRLPIKTLGCIIFLRLTDKRKD